MNKQLLTILQKRYGLFLLIICIAIIIFYGFLGISDVNYWKDMESYYDSEEFVTELKKYPEDIDPMHKTLSTEALRKYYKKESLMLFIQTDTTDEYEPIEIGEERPYFSIYFNEKPLLLLTVVSLIGFLMFFVDLKTSFNEFLFSLGVSKRRIYFTKYLLIALPVLSSVLAAKALYFGIVTQSIPAEYVNIEFIDLLMNVFAVWAPLVFYFSVSAFIGLITGHMILAPLTLLGFCFSFETFVTSLINMDYYFTSNTSKQYVFNFFQYEVTKNSITLFPIVFALIASFCLFVLGAFLFPTLTLEKKENYLLFDKLRVPVIIGLTIYIPSVLVFSRSFYTAEYTDHSPIIRLVIYGLFTALVTTYIIFKKEIQERLNQKRQIKRNISLK